MKIIILSIFITSCLFFSCESTSKDKNNFTQKQYIEKELPFTDLFNFRIKNNDWIRNKENILTVHETLKKSFYKRYLTDKILNHKPLVKSDIYYNISLKTKIDSLIITYPNAEKSSKYYQEFWNRRKIENNDSTVNLVLTEIQQIINGQEVKIRTKYLNATLQKLIEMWGDYENITAEIALNHFEFFRKMNMNQSAYNLLFENSFYSNLKLNRDSLKSLLKTEKVNINSTKKRNIYLKDNTK